MSKCIVSFASTGRENYPKGQLRLIKSINESGWDGGLIMKCLDGYVDEYLGRKIELGSYPKSEKYSRDVNHESVPYGFKVDLIQEARERGYEQIIWCDSTILIDKYPNDTLAHAAEHGVAAFHNLGHDLYKYCSDIALERQGVSEEELMTIPQIMACCVAFDFNSPKGEEAFKMWMDASWDGVSFQNYGSEREGFITHKHDQSCLSLILWKLKIPLLPYGKLVYHPHDITSEYGNNFEIINKGL